MSSFLQNKTHLFAVRIVKLCQVLNRQKEYVLSEKLLHCGTALGALAAEATNVQNDVYCVYKLNVALKEANETQYWLRLLKDTGLISPEVFDTMDRDLNEILRMLISSIKSAKASQN